MPVILVAFIKPLNIKIAKLKKKYIDDILHCKILRLNPGQLAEKFGNFAFMIIALPV
jgi:hypothetical protein